MGKVIVRPPLLNERLKQLRKEFGYSYKKLEELTGISRSSLQRYEANPHSDIPLNKLNTIAEVYKVSVSYLLGYESRDMPFEYLKAFPLFSMKSGMKFIMMNIKKYMSYG